MATQYKLTYFDQAGRAEFLRWMLVVAGQDFEDCRLSGPEEWAKLKPSTPFGHIPTLEINGKTVCESLAIARYLSTKYDLGGKTEEEEFLLDGLAYSCNDLAFATKCFAWENDPEVKATKVKKFTEEQLPRMMDNWTKILESNKDGDVFFVGNKMTWVDMMWASYIANTEIKRVNCPPDWSRWPKLKALRARVESHPKIAEWRAKHTSAPHA